MKKIVAKMTLTQPILVLMEYDEVSIYVNYWVLLLQNAYLVNPIWLFYLS